MKGYPLECRTCGRSGSTDDAIEIGGPCQDEECEGTIVASDESIAEHDYVKPPGAGEQGHLRLDLGLAMLPSEIVGVANALRVLGWDVVAEQITDELAEWTTEGSNT